MKKIKPLLSIAAIIFSCQELLAFDFDSDTSEGSSSFTEALSISGDFGGQSHENTKKGIWNFDYTLTRVTSTSNTGADIIDQTNEFDAGIGESKKDDYEYGFGLTYANTPQENLKDIGPNIYFSLSSYLKEKKEDFTPEVTYKLTLSDLTYTQTFSATFTSRNGRVIPTDGSSSISQFFPKLEVNFDIFSALSIKLSYTCYFYSKSVSGFLQTLDSPRAVAVGLGSLGSAVSGFNSDLKEVEFTITPYDSWEINMQDTEATSALDSSAGWTFKEGVLYDFAKHWRGGVAFQYVTNSLLTDHVYTLSVKYSTD